ncbi:MAG: hypothetical protein K6F29_02410 [Bacteroidales bacterium]|nr:hypothetical protein [Bacteroidales bacterium]
MKKVLLIVVFAILASGSAMAQYKHSIGGVVGSMNGFSYKVMATNNFAISVDLGVKLTEGAFDRYSASVFDLEVNPNFMYEANATGGLYWFVGGGFSLGYGSFNYAGWRTDCGKFGLNAIGGLEYKFGIPLTLQFDFRPGFGLLFYERPQYWLNGDIYRNPDYFDWGLNLSLRYAF